MPIWRNMPSMPKVRASSGTIGTMFLPMFLSRTRLVRMRTNTIVVDAVRSPEPSSWPRKVSRPGTVSGAIFALRAGR